MPSFTLDATIKVVDEAAFANVVKQFVDREMKRAVRAFLKACLARIPVRTGFLAGSFSEINKAFAVNYLADINPALAKIVKDKKFLSRVKQPVEPTKEELRHLSGRARAKTLIEHRKKNLRLLQSKAKRKLVKGEYYYGAGSPILKTPTSGVQFATPPGDIIQVTPEGATFTLDVDITYYRIMDFHSRGGSSPWNSLDAGAMAMTNSLEESINRFPDIDYVLANLNIQLRGTQVTTRQDKAQTLFLTPFNEG